jgi:predicted O-methyltransferase YrrM
VDDALRQVLERAGLHDRVCLVVGDANEVQAEEAYDFAFIDGDHSYEGARRDHNRWGQRVRPGGYLIHHDMAKARRHASQWTDLARLRGEILSRQGATFKLVAEEGSLSVFQRTGHDWDPV